MGKGLAFAEAVLRLIAFGTPIANIADNAAASPATNLYASLHTADPTAGTQSTSEISYTGYARVAVPRSILGLIVTGTGLSPLADIEFALMTAGSGGTASYAAIGIGSAGAGLIIWAGALSPTIPVTAGAQPVIAAGSLIAEF